ncbi:hypothetical protein FOA43_000271 [Brettanomyces nanus]|uniref:Acireductone dioxygenase n=1 Tax=Eeniella nana TaxID=13502 RepID=A0A875RSX6_EENNA|nr:uncharacterized protein FOA43_000271 [Brettanomyces nanus]QPG72967.1 hypothetical protein FOA43_000271 [Brettanomyces nanus]
MNQAQFYYYDEESDKPYTDDHNSGQAVDEKQLANLGVFYKHLRTLEEVDILARKRDYKNRDTINLKEEGFPGGKNALDAKLDMFFQEHLHEDEEIRFILDGEGFFDVRDINDRWIRAKVFKHDLLIIPAGIFHRFTLSNSKYVKALRLFKDEPKWQAFNRTTPGIGENPYRKQYLDQVLTK